MGKSNSKSIIINEPEKISSKFGKILLNQIKDANGLVLQGKHIKEELLAKILENLDFNSLIMCRLVCKQWYLLIQDIVIQQKIESMLCCPPVDEPALWRYFKAIWGARNIPYNENLMTWYKPDWGFWRRRVSDGSWNNIHDLGEYILVDHICWKQQEIDLNKWFPQYILDNIKPTMIKLWEFYTSEYRCGKYEFKVELIKSEESLLGRKDVIIDSCSFSKKFEKREDRGRWFKVTREFIIYEKGLNKIKFYHDFTKGVKVGGSTVIIKFPCRRKVRQLKPYKIDLQSERVKSLEYEFRKYPFCP